MRAPSRKKVLLGLTLLPVLLVGLEIVLRIQGYARGPALYFDSEVGYRCYPGQTRAMLARGEVIGDFSSNELGYRGPVYGEPRREGVPRIACLGDSFTFGLGVREEETWPVVLQRILELHFPDGVEVMNFGFPGYTTVNELKCYRKIVRPFRPDVVVLGYVLNDTAPEERGLRFSDSLPFRLFGRTAVMDAFNRHLRHRLPFLSAEWTEDDARRMSYYEENKVYVQKNPDEPEARSFWQESLEALSELVKEVRNDGAQILVVCFPTSYQLTDLKQGALAGETDFEQLWVETTLPQRYLGQKMAEQKAPYLDLLPAFWDSEVNPMDSPAKGHPGVLGSRIIAQGVALALRDLGAL